MKRNVIALFFCMLIINVGGYGWAATDSFEPDDTFDSATVISTDTQAHNFHDPSDEDWVKVDGSLGSAYSIEAKNLGSNCNVVLELYYADGTTLLDEQNDIADPQADELLEWTCSYTGVYYARIRQHESCLTSDTYCENTEYNLSLQPVVGGPSGFIAGTVTDAYSNEPIQGATITTDGGGSASSLPNGTYIINHQAGTFTVTANASGYDTATYSGINVGESGITTKDIGLVPESTNTEPTALITLPSSGVTINEGESVNFQGSVTGGNAPFAYLWNFDGGATNSAQENPGGVTFLTEAVYTVTFTVTDDDGDTSSDTVTVTVKSELWDTDGDGTSDGNDTDDDNDGLPDEEERGPNGNDLGYDGNGDGTADRLQNNVASFHTYNDQNYVTLEVPAGIRITSCLAVANPSPENGPSGVDFPYGFFEFNIEGMGAGGVTTVTLHCPSGAVFDTYYKFGPTPNDDTDHWYEFLYNGQTGAEINANVITLHFVDSVKGDDDLASNGIIIDVGGPGVPAAGIGFTPVDCGTGSGCFIATAADASFWHLFHRIFKHEE